MSNPKNLADVADKAIDKIADGTAAVVDAFQKLAPEAWQALVMRVQIEAIANAVLWCVTMAFIVALELVTYRKFKLGKIDDEICGLAMIGVAVIVALPLLIFVFSAGPETVGAIIVPEYYAAKEILEAIR